MTPLGRVAHRQGQGRDLATGQGRNLAQGHIPQEGEVPGPTPGHVLALPDPPTLDLGKVGSFCALVSFGEDTSSINRDREMI